MLFMWYAYDVLVVSLIQNFKIFLMLIYHYIHYKIVEMYRRKHFSCFLYLGSILVDIYGAEDEFKSGLVEMMQVRT